MSDQVHSWQMIDEAVLLIFAQVFAMCVRLNARGRIADCTPTLSDAFHYGGKKEAAVTSALTSHHQMSILMATPSF